MLQTLLGEQVFVWLLVLARIGSAFMVMPGIGDTFVSTRTRLLFAVAVSVLVAPVLHGQLPREPVNPFAMTTLVASEITIGIFLGSVARLLMGALDIAGSIIALQAGLSNAQVFNPTMASPGTLPGSLMGWLGLLLIFVTDLHHLLITAVVDSYTVFVPGAPLPVDDMMGYIGQLTGRVFAIGVQLSAPFLITGLLFAVALGLISKMAPQVQVFFLFTSLQVGMGLLLFALTLSAMMMYWLTHFESAFVDLLRPSLTP
jgi:flagellar biosynthetic protein FliR